MSFAEKMAAKRAALLNVEIAVENVVASSPTGESPGLEKASAVLSDLVKEEPPVSNGPRVLTFAEKMALKKGISLQVQNEMKKEEISSPLKEKIHDKIVSVLKEAQEQDDLEREEYKAASPEIKQGYRDIKGRVEELADTDDNNLADAMSQLKKALLANPSACLLMLDEDIGKMTIALRRLTQEALVAATKDKVKKESGKKTKSTSQIPMSEEQMQKVLDEL